MPLLSSQDWLVPKVALAGVTFYVLTGYLTAWLCGALGVQRSVRHYASLVQFTTLSALNVYLFYGETWWFSDVSQCFSEENVLASEVAAHTALHLMYGLHIANDLRQLWKNLMALTIVQTSASILLVHDFVTLGLVMVSWYSNYGCIGVVIMFIHDFTDVTFHLALVVFETGSEHFATWFAYLLAVQQWVYFRIYKLSSTVYVIYNVWQRYKHMPEEEWRLEYPRAYALDSKWIDKMVGMQVQFMVGFLCTLVVMHTVWLCQIIQKIAFDDESKATSPKNRSKEKKAKKS